MTFNSQSTGDPIDLKMFEFSGYQFAKDNNG